MSKKKKETDTDVPIEHLIDEILGNIGVETNPRYDDDCSGCSGTPYVVGRDEASTELATLFKRYVQAELQRRGITEVI